LPAFGDLRGAHPAVRCKQVLVEPGGNDGSIIASFTGYNDWKAGKTYLPAKLPDGTTVYVTIDTGSAKTFAVGDNLTTQLMELENGLQVSPTSEPPAAGTPAEKPTVNCNANCNN
jgi:hypothetical protein